MHNETRLTIAITLSMLLLQLFAVIRTATWGKPSLHHSDIYCTTV